MTLLFFFPPYEALAKEIAESNQQLLGSFSIERFSNQELHATVHLEVKDQTCFLLGSIAPPESNLLSFMILSDTLKKEGAKKCIAILPYLAYSRHEHLETGKSQVTSLIGRLLLSAKIDEIITVDVHSKEAVLLFPIPIVSISPAKLFAEEIKKIAFIPDTIISPDLGAASRSQDVATILSTPILHMKKIREKSGVFHLDLDGHAGKKVIIIDDILDTGQTLISCCQKLLEQGVEEIIIMISHGLFTEDLWKELWDLNVKKIYCTNTVSSKEDPRISVLSITPLLKDCLCSQLSTYP